MKEIYFYGNNPLRVYQIKYYLNKYFNKYNIKIINNISNLKLIKNSIIIWVKPEIHKYKNIIDKSNINILDIIDHFIYYKQNIIYSLKKNYYNGLIVNSMYMLILFKKYYFYKGDIYIIPHHYDKRFLLTKTITINNKLEFGYIGSILSLNHSDNFLHYKSLIKKYKINFYDTEYGKDVTNNVYNNNYNNFGNKTSNNIPKFINFNCDFNIRQYNTKLSKYKTCAKLATAVAMNHNIITTFDIAIVDILPLDYPFILKKTDLKSIIEMIELVKTDYYDEKKLWNKGLNILKSIKNKLSIENIIKKYDKIIQYYNN